MNIKNSILYFIKYKYLNKYGYVQRVTTSKIFGMVSTWKKKKKQSSKYVDEESYNRNERGGN